MDMGSMDHSGGSGCKVSMLWNWDTIDSCESHFVTLVLVTTLATTDEGDG